jgi:catechol 2,3-dioxygenase-like lactoylglutathione lyase family enzyme
MQALTARTVFFVRDTPRAMAYYTGVLGCSLDWTHEEHGQPFVVQVSLFGLQVILNQAEAPTADRPGAGRIFVGLDSDQSAALLQQVRRLGTPVACTHWGAPTFVIRDLDRNEIFLWVPESEQGAWRAASGEPLGT